MIQGYEINGWHSGGNLNYRSSSEFAEINGNVIIILVAKNYAHPLDGTKSLTNKGRSC